MCYTMQDTPMAYHIYAYLCMCIKPRLKIQVFVKSVYFLIFKNKPIQTKIIPFSESMLKIKVNVW